MKRPTTLLLAGITRASAQLIVSSPVTLLTWKPTDPVALMPGDGIRNYKQDRQAASYGDQPGNWLGGYSIQSTAVREYMDSHPWHAKVVSQGQTKYDADLGILD